MESWERRGKGERNKHRHSKKSMVEGFMVRGVRYWRKHTMNHATIMPGVHLSEWNYPVCQHRNF